MKEIIFENMVNTLFFSTIHRELPCILSLFSDIREDIDTIVLDGYVSLGDRPGLGAHLGRELGPQVVIIGVAKTFYKDSRPVEVFRGQSRKPLYVTTLGIEPGIAANHILSMHGKHRIPELLKEADRLSRLNRTVQ